MRSSFSADKLALSETRVDFRELRDPVRQAGGWRSDGGGRKINGGRARETPPARRGKTRTVGVAAAACVVRALACLLLLP